MKTKDVWKSISKNGTINEKSRKSISESIIKIYLLFIFLIIMHIGVSFAAEECKKKWKTLRIQQRRIIIKKIKKNEKRSAIQWNCYDALKFLIPHMDWTATEKNDTELDLTVLCDDDGDDEDADECDDNCESQSESSYSESSQICNNDPVQAADSTNIPRCTLDTQICTGPTFTPGLSDANKVNHQYLVAYLPTVGTTTHTQPIQIRAEPDLLIAANAANCNTPNASIFATTSAATAESTAHSSSASASSSSTTTHPLDSKYSSVSNQRIVTVPVGTGPTIVNYFLMDLAVQMERLNDIAQMELKIEIHRLLLEKLKNVNNLRQAQTSICFTTPQNTN